MNGFSILIIALVVGTSVMMACCLAAKSNESLLPTDELNRLVYEFIDSSKKPEYQRNYIITVKESEAKIKVTSDKTLVETSVKLDKNKFDEIVQAMKRAEFRKRPEVNYEACNGGTTDRFEFYTGDKSVFSAFVYHCGKSDSGNLTGDYKSIKEKLQSLFPNFKDLIN